MLKKVELGIDAIDHLTEALEDGSAFANPSISFYLSKLPLREGRMTTYWPTHMNQNDINKFNSVVLFHRTKKLDIRGKIENLIMEYLRNNKNGYAVFESLVMKGDPIYHNKERNFVTQDSNVYIYHFVRSLDYSNIQVSHAFNSARYYPLVVALTKLSENVSPIEPFQELSDETIKELVDNTDIIITDVYDGTGFLIWKRPGN